MKSAGICIISEVIILKCAFTKANLKPIPIVFVPLAHSKH